MQNKKCFERPKAESEFVNVSGAQESILRKSIPSAYVAWRTGTSNRVFVPARQAGNRFLGSLKGIQIRPQDSREPIVSL